LRQRVHEIAKAMLRDGLSKVHTVLSDWWLMDFQIERDGMDLKITYLDFGEWHPVPKKYELGADVTELLKLGKHKTRKTYELDVSCDGIVSIDKERELLLMPGLNDPDVD
jgi:hypothetical protein